mmetsp:Transcript_58839/g.126453  ORF Transcript_58839/g.126453 Transcript_58839/m.126453 type:complete len:83 (+) Transcript_58839:740-988(+)
MFQQCRLHLGGERLVGMQLYLWAWCAVSERLLHWSVFRRSSEQVSALLWHKLMRVEHQQLGRLRYAVWSWDGSSYSLLLERH